MPTGHQLCGRVEWLQQQVQAKLAEREQLRRKKMYGKADAIQEELRERMGVALDNRKKTYSFD